MEPPTPQSCDGVGVTVEESTEIFLFQEHCFGPVEILIPSISSPNPQIRIDISITEPSSSLRECKKEGVQKKEFMKRSSVSVSFVQIISVVANISGEGTPKDVDNNSGKLTLPSVIEKEKYLSLEQPEVCLAILDTSVTPNVWKCLNTSVTFVESEEFFLWEGNYLGYGVYAFILDICPGPLCGNSFLSQEKD